MNTITKTYDVFSYDELSEKGKEVALNWMSEANSGDEWWESTYEDASSIGLKIKSFDCGRANDITGDLTKDMFDVIDLIIKNHGQSCDTYKLAEQYNKSLGNHLELVLDDDYPDEMDNFASDNEEQFTKELLEEYLSILRKEYDSINSRKYLEEQIKANEYTFLENGKMFN